jgi:RNA polymerase sigma-70 factor (ECF subfamily)
VGQHDSIWGRWELGHQAPPLAGLRPAKTESAANVTGRPVAAPADGTCFVLAADYRNYDVGYQSAAPWLYGIATKLVGQHHRQEARQLRTQQAAAPALDEPGHEERVAADMTARALREQLTEALAGLPQGQRDVLLLIAWEQLSYDDAASVLSIPVGTVRSRLSRARAWLRPALAETSLAANIEEILSNE